MEKKYYYIIIDKLEKTLQIAQISKDSCTATVQSFLEKKYGLTRMMSNARFELFFNNELSYIDYDKFYKKYAKWKVVDGIMEIC